MPLPSPEARAEAAAWLARLHAEDRNAADEAGLTGTGGSLFAPVWAVAE